MAEVAHTGMHRGRGTRGGRGAARGGRIARGGATAPVYNPEAPVFNPSGYIAAPVEQPSLPHNNHNNHYHDGATSYGARAHDGYQGPPPIENRLNGPLPLPPPPHHMNQHERGPTPGRNYYGAHPPSPVNRRGRGAPTRGGYNPRGGHHGRGGHHMHPNGRGGKRGRGQMRGGRGMRGFAHGGRGRGGRGGGRGGGGYRPNDCVRQPLPGETTPDVLLTLDCRQWLRQNRDGVPDLNIGDPKEIAFYSRDQQGEITLHSRESLYSYRDPEEGVSLGYNYSTFFDRGYQVLSIDPALEVLPQGAEVHFLSLRTCLENIASTPYNFRYQWSMSCVQNMDTDGGGAVVLHHMVQQDNEITPEQQLANYYAHSFKAYATGTLDENDATTKVSALVEFRTVITRLLGPLRIAFAAQIDAKDTPDGGDPSLYDYVKLRTVKEPVTEQDKKTFYGAKLRKLWFQAFFAGTGSVAVGMRDDDGTLTRVIRVDTMELPRIANEQLAILDAHPWRPSVMLGFLQKILHLIRRVCAQHPSVQLVVRYSPEKRVVEFARAE